MDEQVEVWLVTDISPKGSLERGACGCVDSCRSSRTRGGGSEAPSFVDFRLLRLGWKVSYRRNLCVGRGDAFEELMGPAESPEDYGQGATVQRYHVFPVDICHVNLVEAG